MNATLRIESSNRLRRSRKSGCSADRPGWYRSSNVSGMDGERMDAAVGALLLVATGRVGGGGGGGTIQMHELEPDDDKEEEEEEEEEGAVVVERTRLNLSVKFATT